MSQNEEKGTRLKAFSSKKVVRRSPSCRTGDDGLVSLLYNTYGHFTSEFYQQLLDMRFCVHLQVGQVKIKMLILILPFFQIFKFSFCHSHITHMDILHQFSQKLLDLGRIMKYLTILSFL